MHPAQNIQRPSFAIEIYELQAADDASPFRTLNEEWITRFFTLEDADRKALSDPYETILNKGGHIYMVRQAGEIVGCVALVAVGNSMYELSKMAVAPELRGKGIGRTLLLHAIAQARSLGARSLFLGSSTKLAGAVKLYESVGFRHVPPERLPPLPYTRA